MRADVRAIRDDLHADTLDVTGDGVERLTATAAEAAERGLHVWLQPTLGDVPRRDILDHLAEPAGSRSGCAGRARASSSAWAASSGCSCRASCRGTRSWSASRTCMKGNFDPVRMQRELDRFTAKAAGVGPLGLPRPPQLRRRPGRRGRLEPVRRRRHRLLLLLPPTTGLRTGVAAVPALGQAGRHHRVRHLHVRRRPRGGRYGLEHRRLRQGPAGDQGGRRPQRAHPGRLSHRAPGRLRVDGPLRGDGLRVPHRRRPASPRRPPPRPRHGELRHRQGGQGPPRRPAFGLALGTEGGVPRAGPPVREGALTRSRGPRPAACPWPGSGTRSRPRTRCRCRGRRRGRWSRW